MEFRLLGPLEVIHSGGLVSLGGPQRRLVLALFLTRPNGVVSTDVLIDGLWGDSPPEAARKSLQAHVASLRRVINVDGELLRSRPPGYVLEVDTDQLDWLRLEREVGEARALLDSDPAAARSRLAEALGLWRGPPLSDLGDEPSLRPFITRMEQLRLEALETRMEADLAVGGHQAVVGELEGLAREYPLRERLWAELMLALYRSGRQADALRAYQEARRVLSEELGIEPSPQLKELEQRILDQHPILQTRRALATVTPVEVESRLRNPYKGLRAFGEEDAGDFFGREDLVRRLLERLDRRGVEGRLVAVAGPSGSGKSSVVRAGLIPALRAGALPGAQHWRICDMFPGSYPLEELAKALSGLIEEAPGDLVSMLQGPDVNLKDIASELFGDDTVLLVLDQFEELFTLVNDPATRDGFLQLVASALVDRESGLRVVLTIRADFLDRPLLHPGFAPLLDQGLVLVTPLSGQGVRAAVVEPAARVGVSLESDLIAEMLRDVATRPAALPLVQYALTDLFDHRRGNTLTLDSYQAAGGFTGALAGRADDLYKRLDPTEQNASRQLFLRLVTLTDGAEHLRRRVARSELEDLPVEQAALDTVMEQFGQYRLLTFDRDPDTGDATVEIAHEALLREWPRLREWIEVAHEGLLLQRRLSAALQDWRQAGEDASYLVGGGRLEQFETWIEETDLAVTQDEREFIAAGRVLEDRQRRQRNLRRWSMVGVLAIAVVALLALAVVIPARERAATARELAAASNTVADTDPQLGLLLAFEAMKSDQDAREAVEALHRAVTESRVLWQATWEEDLPFARTMGVEISPDDSLVAMTGDGATVILRNRENGDLIRTLTPEVPVNEAVNPGRPGVSFSPDGELLAAFGPDDVVRVWEVPTGDLVVRLTAATGDRDGNRTAEFGPTGRWLYTSAAGSEPVPVIQWNVDTWTEERRWDIEGVVAGGVAVSPDGALLAVPFQQRRQVLVLDTETGAEVTNIAIEGDNEVGPVAFSNIGALAIAADGHISLWDPRTGEQIPIEFTTGVLDRVIGLEFDPIGTRLATGLQFQGSLSVWDLSRPFEEVPRALRLPGHTSIVGDVSFDSRGETLVSGSGDRTVRLWDVSLTGRGEVTSVGSRFPNDITFFDEGRRLAVATYGDAHGMQLVDLAGGEQLRIPEAYSRRIAFTDDETRFAAQIVKVDEEGAQLGELRQGVFFGEFEPAIGIWDTQTGNLIQQLPAPETCPGTDNRVPGSIPAFSHDGRFLAVGYPCEQTVRVWDVPSNDLITEIEHGLEMLGVVFAPDDSHVVTVATDGKIRFWDTGGWSLASEVASGGNLTDVAFSPAGDVAATPGFDGILQVWDTQDWSLLRTMTGHAGAVENVTFNQDGSRLATAGNDRTVRIWNVETGKELWKLEGHPNPIESVAFHPNGKHIASMSATNWAVWIWTLDTDELIEIAESRLTRRMTDRECEVYLRVESCAFDQ